MGRAEMVLLPQYNHGEWLKYGAASGEERSNGGLVLVQGYLDDQSPREKAPPQHDRFPARRQVRHLPRPRAQGRLLAIYMPLRWL